MDDHMPRTVSASEAQSRFGSMLRWADENEEGVIVERRGNPAGAIISYEAYQELERLRQQEKKRQALETIRKLRQEVQERTEGLSEEEAYRLAGFSEEPLQELVAFDQQREATPSQS